MKTILFIALLSFAFSYINLNAQSDDKATTIQSVESSAEKINNDIDKQAAEDYNGTKSKISKELGISSAEIDNYVKKDNMKMSDVYNAGMISKQTGKPINEVMSSYKKNKSWGKTAQSFGIKPGSESFQQMKDMDSNTGEAPKNMKSNDLKNTKSVDKSQKSMKKDAKDDTKKSNTDNDKK